MAQQPPSGLRPPRYRGFTITLRHTTHGRTPLDERSARRRDLYLITHNTHKRHTCIPLARFEPTIPKSERPQTHALDQAARGIGFTFGCMNKNEWQYMVAWIPFWTYLSHCLKEAKNIFNISWRGKKLHILWPWYFFIRIGKVISYTAFLSWLERHCTNTNKFLYWEVLIQVYWISCLSVSPSMT